MPTFSDYAFYQDHGGKLPEEAYLAVVEDAYAEILSQTNCVAQAYPAEMEDALKLCECALVDSIDSYKRGTELLPRGVASVNNDGLMVSAGSGGLTAYVEEASERHRICARYLQAPVNLMCRWL